MSSTEPRANPAGLSGVVRFQNAIGSLLPPLDMHVSGWVSWSCVLSCSGVLFLQPVRDWSRLDVFKGETRHLGFDLFQYVAVGRCSRGSP